MGTSVRKGWVGPSPVDVPIEMQSFRSTSDWPARPLSALCARATDGPLHYDNCTRPIVRGAGKEFICIRSVEMHQQVSHGIRNPGKETFLFRERREIRTRSEGIRQIWISTAVKSEIYTSDTICVCFWLNFLEVFKNENAISRRNISDGIINLYDKTKR